MKFECDTAIDLLPVGVAAYDTDERFVFANVSFADFLQVDRCDIVNYFLSDIIHGSELLSWRQHDAVVLGCQRVTLATVDRISVPQGEVSLLCDRWQWIEDGAVVGILLCGRDITHEVVARDAILRMKSAIFELSELRDIVWRNLGTINP